MSNIPYILEERPDTGLNNSKLGVWIFLASEVMLFGGLFSAYVFLRIAAPEGDFGYWGSKLNVPMATFNTLLLITSSVTMVMSWASLKLNDVSSNKKVKDFTITIADQPDFNFQKTATEQKFFKFAVKGMDTLPNDNQTNLTFIFAILFLT